MKQDIIGFHIEIHSNLAIHCRAIHNLAVLGAVQDQPGIPIEIKIINTAGIV
jgi:hypothetical protein